MSPVPDPTISQIIDHKFTKFNLALIVYQKTAAQNFYVRKRKRKKNRTNKENNK